MSDSLQDIIRKGLNPGISSEMPVSQPQKQIYSKNLASLPRNRARSKKMIFGSVMALVLTLGMGALVGMTQQSQDQRSQADVMEGAGLSFLPQTVSMELGTTTTMSVILDSKQYHVTAAGVIFEYDPSVIEVNKVIKGEYFSQVLKESQIDHQKGLVTMYLGQDLGEISRSESPVLTFQVTAIGEGQTTLKILDQSIVTALKYDQDMLTDLGSTSIKVGGLAETEAARDQARPEKPVPVDEGVRTPSETTRVKIDNREVPQQELAR